MSNENRAEEDDKFALVDRVNKLERLIAEMNKIPRIGAKGLEVWQYPAYATPIRTVNTIPAGATRYRTFSYRYEFLGDFVVNLMMFEPACSIKVDVDDASQYTFGDIFGALSSGQENFMYSLVRNWELGLTPMDPNNLLTYTLMMHNFDSSPHTYYCDTIFYGPNGVEDLVSVI